MSGASEHSRRRIVSNGRMIYADDVAKEFSKDLMDGVRDARGITVERGPTDYERSVSGPMNRWIRSFLPPADDEEV